MKTIILILFCVLYHLYIHFCVGIVDIGMSFQIVTPAMITVALLLFAPIKEN